MSKTPNYELNKPAQTDFYDVDVQNENMDKIDKALANKVDKVVGKGLSTNDYNATDKGKVDNLPTDTNTELGKKVNNQTFDNHKNDTNIHTTSAEKEKWNKGVQKVTGATTGNFSVFDSEGGIVDSNKKPSDFLGSAHGTATIIGEPGLHGIRYWNEKLEVLVDGAWKQASSGVGIEVNVTVPTGSVVTATDGENVVTGTAVNNALKVALPNYGSWVFSATLDGETSNTVTLNCDTSKVYSVTLTYFTATIKVTAKSGSVVTIKKGSVVQTATSTGTATFTVKEAGTYSVYATYDGVNSNTVTVNATTSGGSYAASVSFITLTVSIKTGSTVVVTKGSYSYSKVSTGTAVFYLPETGTWSVTASLSGDTATGTISCSSYTAYSITLNYFKIFGVSIDLTNSDPASAVTYTDDAVGMTAGGSAWDSEPIFKDIKPCLLLNGVVQKYLNKNNFAQDEDGNSADITSGSGGDVMIEIPKCGVKIATSGNTLTIKITDNPNATADGFHYYAHTRATEGDCDKLYIGAYVGYSSSSKLRSLSGKSPTVDKTIGAFRTLAQANGDGYDQISFYPLTLLQCLFLIRYKNRNSQTALGRGYVDGSVKTNTGATNANGMYYGSTSGTTHVKFAGIEDFWGNIFYFIDGIYSDSNRNILTAFDNFNDTGSGYTSRGQGATSNIGNYMSKPQGTTETGFIAKEVNGSSTTHFCDSAILSASRLALFGGAWAYGDGAGAFRLGVNRSASDSNSSYGGRLMYLKAS